VELISWNIQWCRGMDGKVDPARIAREVKRLCDPDVCCLQEVSDNYDSLAGSAGENQVELLKSLFKGYSAHFAWAVDVADGGRGRRRFGNMILSRLPVRQVFRHSLPWPADDGCPNMPRVALEAVIEASWGAVSVTTTHLEAYSAMQRAAQVARLREIHAERLAHAASSPSTQYKSGPFQPFARPAASILAGDFNMRADDPSVAELKKDYADAWQAAHPGRPHPPSFGVFDAQFGTDPYCCDFVFVSRDLVPRIGAVAVDDQTDASDHQPVIATFA
jgi:endonuclease/exonuclease/phosphatase family metal-dependent hydrolase